MYYIYDLTTRKVQAGVDTQTAAESFSTNWTNVGIAKSLGSIPTRFQGYWIINEQFQLENII
jgi:hypothetical protein